MIGTRAEGRSRGANSRETLLLAARMKKSHNQAAEDKCAARS